MEAEICLAEGEILKNTEGDEELLAPVSFLKFLEEVERLNSDLLKCFVLVLF